MTTKEMLQMRMEGATYQEIADKCGISRQRVHQKIGKRQISRFKEISQERCVYVGLRNWMNTNKICIAELTRRIYGQNDPDSNCRTRGRLASNCDLIPKRFIDKILKITGLTYEEAFRKDEVQSNEVQE